jgi:hypothetical protein
LKYWCILYIKPYSLELSRSTCSCQHGPSLHSGIRQSLWREKVDVLDCVHGPHFIGPVQGIPMYIRRASLNSIFLSTPLTCGVTKMPKNHSSTPRLSCIQVADMPSKILENVACIVRCDNNPGARRWVGSALGALLIGREFRNGVCM